MIKDLINEQTKILNEEKKHTNEKSSFWASDALKCKRKVYYEFKNKSEAEDYDPRILRIFQCGDDVHSRICTYLEMAGVLEDIEVEIPKNDYNITGRIDVMLKDGTIVEIKSINSKIVTEPIEEHIGQLQLYLFLFGNTINGPRKGILVYESKVNQEIFEFKIKLDMDIVNSILNDFNEIEKYLKLESPPKKDIHFRKERYPCKYCNYITICYKEEKNESNQPDT